MERRIPEMLDRLTRSFEDKYQRYKRDISHMKPQVRRLKPAVDAFEDELTGHLILFMNIAGANKSDVDIIVEDEKRIAIHGVIRQDFFETRSTKFHLKERRFGFFDRLATFDKDQVDLSKPENVEAKIENGVLVIRVPKRDGSKEKMRVAVE